MVLFDVESIAKAIIGLYIPSFEAVVLAIFVAVIPVGVGFYIYCRQEKIINKQLEIATKQNEIALFDKRYKVYKTYDQFSINFNNILNIPNLFSETQNDYNCERFTYLFHKVIGYDSNIINSDGDSNATINLFKAITPFIDELEKIPLLFETTIEDEKIINDLREDIVQIYKEAYNFCSGESNKFEKSLNDFLDKGLSSKFHEKIKQQLKVNRVKQ